MKKFMFVMANVVPSSPILATLMMEARSSSETPVLTGATRPKFPEDAILQIHIFFRISLMVLAVVPCFLQQSTKDSY
jgi:hypothetical protein